MKFIKNKIVIAAIVIFIAIQFYRPNKNVQLGATSQDFLTSLNAPENISALFKNSCYNCHSNFTNYYWYDNIAPASWYVDGHIKEGKSELNFSNWTSNNVDKKNSLISQMAVNIQGDIMPLPSYTLVHSDAKLSDEEKEQIMNWLFTLNIE